MGRKTRTQVELLIDALCDIEGHRASLRVLAEYLGWSVEKVERVRKRAMQERPQNVLKANGPGTVTMYVGSGNERVGAGSRLYADISRVIEKKWGPNVLGLRNITTVVTAKAGT